MLRLLTIVACGTRTIIDAVFAFIVSPKPPTRHSCYGLPALTKIAASLNRQARQPFVQ